MAYVMTQDDPLNCEIPHVDWTNRHFSPIPKVIKKDTCDDCQGGGRWG